MARLSINRLTLERAGRVVVRDFCAEAESGSALMIQGLNGSGKSTLLRALGGFLEPKEGEILWDGAPLRQDWRGGGGRIAYLGHQDGVKSGLSIEENLRFWSGLFGAGDVERAMTAMDLAPLRDRPARHLSAGQRRRLALSRLLLGHWDLWLLDEPATSLDIPGRSLLTNLIRRHLDDGGVAVVAYHDPLDLPGATRRLGEEAA